MPDEETQSPLEQENQQLRERVRILEEQLAHKEQLAATTTRMEALKTATVEIQSLEEALQVSEDRFFTLLETASIAILVIDSTGDIMMLNQKAEEIFSFDRSQLIGNPVSKLIPEDLRGGHDKHLKGFFANPRSRPMGQGLDLVAQRQDGSQFPIEVSLSTMETEQGMQGVAFIVDISARKAQELQLRTLLEAASVAVVVINHHGEIILVNKRCEEIFGYRREELLTSSVNQLLPDSLQTGHTAHLEGFFANPRSRPMGQGMDLVAQHSDGSQFPIEVSLSMIKTDQGMQGVAFIVDISERKRAESNRLALMAERERTGILEKFITDVAHDIKTPITTMKTSLYLLQRKLDQIDQPHIVNLNQQVQRLNLLVDGMLEMTRLDQIKELDFQDVDIQELVHTLVLRYEDVAQEKEQVLSEEVKNCPQYIEANPSELNRAVEQILANALHYTPEQGSINIEVVGEEDHVSISMTDTGCGIGEEALPHIFERFYRVDEARTTSVAGNGLGLSIARRIATLHGGSIEAKSQPGVGSTFTLFLPIRQ